MSLARQSALTLVIAGVVPCGFTTGEAGAQQQAASVDGRTLEEIIVTARRREESVQDVPIAITAFGGKELEHRGIEAIQNLNAAAPNVSIQGGGANAESQGSFVVRGIPGVATYIDGIWQSTTDGLFTLEVVDVDRIEVLRGPQGTLFGKNAVGGAIQYITRAPAERFQASASASVGAFNRRDFQASLDAPITPELRTKITAAGMRRDGFVSSLAIDRDYGDVHDQLLRADVLWQPSERFSLRAIAEHSEVDRAGPARVLRRIVDPVFDSATGRNTNPRAQAFVNAGLPYTNATHAAGWRGGTVGEYETRIDWLSPGLITELTRYTADMTLKFTDDLRLRSLTGYREHRRRTQIDYDGAEITLIERDWRAKGRLFTQELQLLGSRGNIDWVVGGYYWRDPRQDRVWTWAMTDFRDPALRQAALAGGRGVTPATVTPVVLDNLTYAQSEGAAVFADLKLPITDRLALALGVRWNEENFETNVQTPVVPVPLEPDTTSAGDKFAVAENRPSFEESFRSVTPRVTVQYRWTPDVMAYIGYSEGFSAGGFTVLNLPYPDVPTAVPYGPEEIKNFEIGLRADWLDRRLRTNVSAFHSDYEGIQVNTYVRTRFPPGAPPGGLPESVPLPNVYLTNAAEARAHGLELEATWAATDRVRFGLNAGWLDAEYTEVGAAANAITVNSRFQQAPELTANVNLAYDIPVLRGVLTPRIDYTYTGDFVLANDDARQITQPAYALVNARLTYEAGANWSIAVFGTNLTDERYVNSGFYSDAFLLEFVTLGRPREYGLTVNVRFH
jgi:iron complex outermembrane recepter protein